MTGDLLIITPTRGRPKNLARLLDSIHELKRLETHVYAAVDNDDPEVGQYQHVIHKAGQPGDVLDIDARLGLAAWTNKVAVQEAGNYKYLASFGDDHVPRTRGFDKALCRGIEDMGGTGFTYPWDGVREDIPEAVVMSSDIVQELGWMCLPSLEHYYVDNVWDNLGRGTGRIRHLRAVAVDHVNAASGQVPGDATYAGASEKYAADKAAYKAWRESQMADDIRSILALTNRRLQPA
jgi:hypothetical protein